jgi:hypothetical protein
MVVAEIHTFGWPFFKLAFLRFFAYGVKRILLVFNEILLAGGFSWLSLAELA